MKQYLHDDKFVNGDAKDAVSLRGKVKMTRIEKENWLCNIQNTAQRVATIYGAETVIHILQKYDASSIEGLSPVYYTEVFDELDFMANDDFD